METSELRQGNVVWEHYGGNYIVRGIPDDKNVTISKTKTTIPVDFKIEDLRPVFLNEKWLLELGFEWQDFEEDHPDYLVFLRNFRGFLFSDRSNKFSTVTFRHKVLNDIEVKYVHQLQNLYFNLTGEELTIKL